MQQGLFQEKDFICRDYLSMVTDRCILIISTNFKYPWSTMNQPYYNFHHGLMNSYFCCPSSPPMALADLPEKCNPESGFVTPCNMKQLVLMVFRAAFTYSPFVNFFFYPKMLNRPFSCFFFFSSLDSGSSRKERIFLGCWGKTQPFLMA